MIWKYDVKLIEIILLICFVAMTHIVFEFPNKITVLSVCDGIDSGITAAWGALIYSVYRAWLK